MRRPSFSLGCLSESFHFRLFEKFASIYRARQSTYIYTIAELPLKCYLNDSGLAARPAGCYIIHIYTFAQRPGRPRVQFTPATWSRHPSVSVSVVHARADMCACVYDRVHVRVYVYKYSRGSYTCTIRVSTNVHVRYINIHVYAYMYMHILDVTCLPFFFSYPVSRRSISVTKYPKSGEFSETRSRKE